MSEELGIYVFLAQFLTLLLRKNSYLVTPLGVHVCRESWGNPAWSLG